VFTFPLIRGDSRDALKGPSKVVLSESTAKKLFNDADPMMKPIEYQNHSFMVSGIMKDVKNSHIQVDALFSHESIPLVYPNRGSFDRVSGNGWIWSATYLLISGNPDPAETERKVNDVLAEINNINRFGIEFHQFRLTALKDIYFEGALRNLDYGVHGNLKLVHILIAVAFFIVLLACINYVNLTTARASVRAREVGIKKVVGSSKRLLQIQLVAESTLLTVIACLIAITMVQIFLSRFNLFAGTDLRLTGLNSPVILLCSLFGAVVLGIVTGIYPAIHLTAIKPVSLMKGQVTRGLGNAPLRTGLMSFQFAISVIMIIGTLVCLRQVQYIQTMDLGFNKEQIITVRTPADFPEEFTLRETLKERLLQRPEIRKVTYSAGHPGHHIPTGSVEIEGLKRTVGFIVLDPDYMELMGIRIVEGRNLSWDREGDRIKPDAFQVNVLLNESAVREFGIVDPVGKSIFWIGEGRSVNCIIVGVVRDFNFRSLHHKIEPLIFGWHMPWNLCSIRISPTDIPTTLKIVEEEWKKVYGVKPFDYRFLDETLERQYKSDEQTATVISYFAGLAIFLACLRLFALSSFMIIRRTKEIGIRKSLGASVKSIYIMLSWDFLRWIVLGAIIACPVAWYLMWLWLGEFAYHVELGVDVLALGTTIAMVIAVLTVTWQSLKAASANPIKALRYE
jgi:putative ABC transport system permease protein